MTIEEIRKQLNDLRNESSRLHWLDNKTEEQQAEYKRVNAEFDEVYAQVKPLSFYYVRMGNGYSSTPNIYLTPNNWYCGYPWPFLSVEEAQKAIMKDVESQLTLQKETWWMYKITEHKPE